MNRRKRWRTLRFEGLETRILLAADVFDSFAAPVTDLCVTSCCESACDASAPANQQSAAQQVVHTSISAADRGSQEDVLVSDLAFAQFGSELADQPPLE